MGQGQWSIIKKGTISFEEHFVQWGHHIDLQKVEEGSDKGRLVQTAQKGLKITPRNKPPTAKGEVPVYQSDSGGKPQSRLHQTILKRY